MCTDIHKSTNQQPKNLIDAKTVLLAIRAVKSMQIGEFKASPFTLFMCIVKQKKERISINRSNTHLREKWRSSTRRSWIGWLCKYHLIFCTFIIYLPFNKFSLSRSLYLFNLLEIDQFSTNLWVSSANNKIFSLFLFYCRDHIFIYILYNYLPVRILGQVTWHDSVCSVYSTSYMVVDRHRIGEILLLLLLLYCRAFCGHCYSQFWCTYKQPQTGEVWMKRVLAVH